MLEEFLRLFILCLFSLSNVIDIPSSSKRIFSLLNRNKFDNGSHCNNYCYQAHDDDRCGKWKKKKKKFFTLVAAV